MAKPRKLFVQTYINKDRSVMIQPWEYESEGIKRLGLLFAITHDNKDAVAHPLTQKEARGIKRYLDKYEAFIRNAEKEGYNSAFGSVDV